MIKQFTDRDELQDEEGVKSVAPPPTALTIGCTMAYGVAVCSLWQYNLPHRGDFWISSSILRYWPPKGVPLTTPWGWKTKKKFFSIFCFFPVLMCSWTSLLPTNHNFGVDSFHLPLDSSIFCTYLQNDWFPGYCSVFSFQSTSSTNIDWIRLQRAQGSGSSSITRAWPLEILKNFGEVKQESLKRSFFKKIV